MQKEHQRDRALYKWRTASGKSGVYQEFTLMYIFLASI